MIEVAPATCLTATLTNLPPASYGVGGFFVQSAISSENTIIITAETAVPKAARLAALRIDLS